MMNLRGNIDIRTINGRNGPFNVGTLTTSLGEFRIKDACIDEFDVGRYAGEFTLERIYPASYFAGPRLIVEIRAKLAEMVLDDVDELPTENDQEPDPADEPDPTPEPASPVAAEPDHGSQPLSDEPSDERLKSLFGELYPLQAQVKLDPTVDRQRFRAQRNALKDLGYRFDFENQVWKEAA